MRNWHKTARTALFLVGMAVMLGGCIVVPEGHHHHGFFIFP